MVRISSGVLVRLRFGESSLCRGATARNRNLSGFVSPRGVPGLRQGHRARVLGDGFEKALPEPGVADLGCVLEDAVAGTANSVARGWMVAARLQGFGPNEPDEGFTLLDGA